MGAILILIIVVSACIYAVANPSDLVESVRLVWGLAMEYPEEMLVLIATLVAPFTMVWCLMKLVSRRRDVVYMPSVVTASLQRRISREIGPELERRARHEAAHTLAAYLLGGTHLTADVHVVGERDGRATYRHTDEGTVWDDAFDDLVIGFAAQVIDHRTGHFDAGSMADMASQQRRVMVILSAGKQPHKHVGPLTVEALIESARAEAEQLLAQHPDDLERLTTALIEDRELDDEEIRVLIQSPAPAIAA